MEARQKFDDILQQLSFGVKTTKNVYRPSGDKNKLPLRQLPKEDAPAKKRRNLNSSKKDLSDGGNLIFWTTLFVCLGIKLFSNSTTTIEAATKRDAEKTLETTVEEKVTSF